MVGVSRHSTEPEGCTQHSNPILEPPTDGRRRNMQAIRRTDTKPEVALRALLHRQGLRFRKDLRLDFSEGRVRPDIVFTRAKVAIFVDSCFWHVCPQHGSVPKRNTAYWEPKLRGNAARDRRDDRLLMSQGWTVVRVWEHEPSEVAVARVIGALSRRGSVSL